MKKQILLFFASCVCLASIANEYVTIVQKIPGASYVSGSPSEVIPPEETFVKFTKIAAGEGHAYALDTNGTVWSIGRNGSGELGLGDNTNRTEWLETELTGVSDISANGFSGYAIKDSEIWVVGRNNNGELGIGTNSNTNEWIPTGYTGFKKVVSGIHHAYAIDDNGSVWGAGSNSYGQIGIGSVGGSVLDWTQSNLTNVVDLEGGYYFGIALKSNGEVWAVGRNDAGQLGVGAVNEHQPSWISVMSDNPSLTNITDVGAGWYHSHVVSNGEVFSTGDNNNGELGIADGDLTNRTRFEGTGLTNVSKVDGGRESSYALKSNGEIWSTGSNAYGQLGAGASSGSQSWIKTSLDGATKTSTDSRFGLALKDGDVWFVGNNDYGISGDGTSSHKGVWTKIPEIAIINE